MSNQYLAKQFSGQLVQDVINQVQIEFEKSLPLSSYWNTMSIENADNATLDAIGYLVGIDWPTSPTGALGDTAFIFGSSASYPTTSSRGYSAIGSLSGGTLSSSLPVPGNKVPASVYKKLLIGVAYAKYHGLSWSTIDIIASSFGTLNYVLINSSFNKLLFGSSANYPDYTAPEHSLSAIGSSTGGRLISSTQGLAPDSDITIIYNTPISTSYLWICQQIFLSICTAPKVTAKNGV